MNKHFHISMLLAAVCCISTTAADAQNDSLMVTRGTHSRMIAVGQATTLDTYLSPEEYTGTEIRFLSHSNKQTIWKHVTQTVIHQGMASFVSNRADYDEIGGGYNFQYHLRYNWRLTDRLTVAAGGGADFNLGFLYNLRNSNNPAQLHTSLNLAPSVAARYDFNYRNAAFSLSYEAMAPLAGIMFSPNYGQSYYEIFNEGDNDHNIVLTTIGATPSLRQMLALDIRPNRRWNKSRLRIGYLGDYQQANVNHLKYHQYSHLLIIGITKSL